MDIQQSLWGDEFTLKEEDVKKIISKTREKKVVKEVSVDRQLKSKKVSISEKMRLIEIDVNKILGSYKENTVTIRDFNSFKEYIDKALENKVVAVDTETNNTLDTIECELVGLCLYTPGMKNAYIPVSHRHFKVEDGEVILGDRIENQITEAQIKEQLMRVMESDTKIIMHNSSFDIGVIMSTCDIRLRSDWDTLLAAKCLNELEHASLKEQFKIHINNEQEKYSIEHLFKGMQYSIFDPELFALYAATDSYMTYMLYEYQRSQFDLEENRDIKSLFLDVEMPCIDSVVDMQQTGICVDVEYANKISVQYHKELDEIDKKISDELERLKPIINAWRLSPEANVKKRVYPAKKTKISEAEIPIKFPLVDEKGNHYKLSGKSPNEQLSDPIEVTSSTQLQILLYDILDVGVIDKSDPRGTGADILEELANKVKICRLILDKREVQILLDTFVDKIPKLVKKKTGRVHAKFNQYGADTGRFSSGEKDPDNPKQKSLNLQNIPSHAKNIRLIFKAPVGYSIVGSDYSAQEPRSTASLANDEEMLRAYDEGKDLYAVIGSICFHNKYEDNLEFNPVTHELQPEGKARRAKAKTILLGITYGMSAHSLAERIDVPQEEAQQIIDNFYAGFKGVDKLTKDSQKMLVEKGYVTDMWGRRRHLPDAQLPDFTITSEKTTTQFNPLLGAVPHEDKALEMKIKQYEDKLSKARWKKDVDSIISQARKEGFYVRNNRGFKSKAMRQCLNARIQGTAASMTKKAMGMIHNDPELQRLGFTLLVTVHDEVFGQVPSENAEAAAKRLSEVMVEAAKEKCVCKFKCDPYIVKRWYEDELSAEVLKDYSKLLGKGLDENSAYLKICDQYSMIQPKYVKMMCEDSFDPNMYEDI